MVQMDADQEVGSDLALFAQHLDVGRDEGEGVFAQGPGQQGVGLLVLPGFGEDRVQVQHEILAVQPQLALAQVAADQAADIARRRCTVGGVETDLLQIGRETELLIAAHVRAKISQHIAQRASRLELIDHFGHALRPRRQRVQQGGDRGQVHMIGLQVPALLRCVCALELLHLRAGFPARIAQAHGQRVQHQVVTLLAAFQPGMQGQVVNSGWLAVCVGTGERGGVESGGGALHRAVTPIEPELTTGPECLEGPALGHAGRQPFGPITLRQADIRLRRAVTPLAGANLAFDTQRNRLAIG